ncbi:hypothetical protein [Sphingomonas lenta]|uniref:hypothetical protein n=1 Tax=Sphingomonas lenta TaxID=1141887 RepID=UPI001140D398|nr:hypothetical protein [Sphingomonas lenta]
MKLLLLLSALLAALSGGGADARAPRAEAVAVAVRVAAPERERAHAHVLLAARPAADRVAEPAASAPAAIVTAAPRLWLQRRRE